MKKIPSILLFVLACAMGLAACDSQPGKAVSGIFGGEETDTVPELPLDTVYITKSGECYHRSYDCVSRHKPRKVHIDYADSIGRRPCENCIGAK